MPRVTVSPASRSPHAEEAGDPDVEFDEDAEFAEVLALAAAPLSDASSD